MNAQAVSTPQIRISGSNIVSVSEVQDLAGILHLSERLNRITNEHPLIQVGRLTTAVGDFIASVVDGNENDPGETADEAADLLITLAGILTDHGIREGELLAALNRRLAARIGVAINKKINFAIEDSGFTGGFTGGLEFSSAQ